MGNNILTPDEIVDLQDKKHIVYVRRAIHDILLGLWMGSYASVPYGEISGRVDSLAGYHILKTEKYVTEVLEEYRAVGWEISYSRGCYVFTVTKDDGEG